MGITGLINRPHSWSYPAMRLRMGICKGDNPRSLSAVEPARRGEKWLRIGGGNFKRRVADAARFGFDEDKELRRPAEGGIAPVKEHGRDGSILLGAAVHVIIHRIAAQFRNPLAAQSVKGALGWAAIYRRILPICREGRSFRINKGARVSECRCGAMNGALHPVQSRSGRRRSANVRYQPADVVVLIHCPGQQELSVVVEALRPQRAVFGLGQGRQKQRRQNRYDRDDDQ